MRLINLVPVGTRSVVRFRKTSGSIQLVNNRLFCRTVLYKGLNFGIDFERNSYGNSHAGTGRHINDFAAHY